MRSVVITGASSGIGRDAALHFNAHGYRVFAGVRRSEDGERVRLEAAHPDALQPLLLDVTDGPQVQAARTEVLRVVGPDGLTAVVSNAGIAMLSGRASCEECPLETQQTLMDINFFGAVRVVQAFLPLLRASRGTVVLNTALMAHTVIPFNGGYAASKSALEAWADSLRREVGPLGVRVAMIEAGYVATRLTAEQPAAAGGGTVYAAETQLQAFAGAQSARFGRRPSASPRRMSEAMLAAVEEVRPRPRRIVGTGSRAIWVLGCLPDRAQDRAFALLTARLTRTSRST